MPKQRETKRRTHRLAIAANISGERRHETHHGREHLVVPLVMVKAGMELHGVTLPQDEIIPEAWNNTPVTVGHPQNSAGMPISANSPSVSEQYEIGRIFNAELSRGGKLQAEAWIDIERAEQVSPGLIDDLVSNDVQMDVSTAWISGIEKDITESLFYTHINPDHLALLPGQMGECSWADGCGVRANRRTQIDLPLKPLEECKMTTENKADDQKRALVGKVISNCSCFKDEDEAALMSMSHERLNELAANAKDDKDEDERMSGNKDEAQIANTTRPPVQNMLSDEDREALEIARQVRNEKREGLITQITANSAMTSEQLKSMDTSTLQTIANGLAPQTDYSVRGFAAPMQPVEESDGTEEGMMDFANFYRAKEEAK